MTRSGLLVVTAAIALAGCGPGRSPERPDRGGRDRLERPRAVRQSGTATSIAELRARAEAAVVRTSTRPGGEDAIDAAADALLRLARITGDPSPAIEAERLVRGALNRDPDAYGPRRQLAAALAAQHRFAEAIAEAERCRAMQPRDGWPLGVIADAAIELGDYDRALDAVEAMLALRPDAGAYARASHLRELQGDVDAAVRLMRMAADAISPGDAEAAAWHQARLGELLLEAGRTREATRAFEHARHLFQNHPDASRGLASVRLAAGDAAQSLALVEELIAGAPSPGDHALAARALRRLGRLDEAAREAKLAEAGWRSDAPDPVRLAHFLVEQGRPSEAVAVVESAGRSSGNVFVRDALAWASFHDGRVARAVDLYAQIQQSGVVPAAVRRRLDVVAQAQAASGGRR